MNLGVMFNRWYGIWAVVSTLRPGKCGSLRPWFYCISRGSPATRAKAENDPGSRTCMLLGIAPERPLFNIEKLHPTPTS